MIQWSFGLIALSFLGVWFVLIVDESCSWNLQVWVNSSSCSWNAASAAKEETCKTEHDATRQQSYMDTLLSVQLVFLLSKSWTWPN